MPRYLRLRQVVSDLLNAPTERPQKLSGLQQRARSSSSSVNLDAALAALLPPDSGGGLATVPVARAIALLEKLLLSGGSGVGCRI